MMQVALIGGPFDGATVTVSQSLDFGLPFGTGYEWYRLCTGGRSAIHYAMLYARRGVR